MTSFQEMDLKQGSIICGSDLKVELKQAIQSARAVVDKREKECTKECILCVLTQDCDLASESHNYIELVQGKKTRKPDARVQLNQNFRKLQLLVDDTWFEFNLDLISVVRKTDVLNGCTKLPGGHLGTRETRIIVDWRVMSYQREPFPHQFNVRMRNYLDNDVFNFRGFLQDNAQKIDDIYVLLEPAENEYADNYIVHLMLLLADEIDIQSRGQIKNKFDKHLERLDQSEGLQIHGYSAQLSAQLAGYAQSPVELPDNIEVATLSRYRRFTWQFLCYEEKT